MEQKNGQRKVYLDFNKWVDMARAHRGDRSHAQFANALTVAMSGVSSGLAAFPLSEDHYWETWARTRAQSRQVLARFMLALSGGQMISGLRQVVPAEIDRSLKRLFGRPTAPRTGQVFGLSLFELCGEPKWEFVPSPDADLTPAQEAAISRFVDRLLLSGPPDGVVVPGHDPQAHRSFGRRFADEQRDLAQTLSGRKGDRLRDALRAKGILDVKGPLEEAMKLAGLPAEVLGSLDRLGLTELLHGISTRWAEVEMLYQHHQNPRIAWRDNDLIDVVTLSIAIVYCDIVVGEKFWIDMARRAGLDREFNTVLLTDLRHLPVALVAPSTKS